MKERPILFNAPMVLAIMDGLKTQTRRVISPRPHEDWKLKSCGILTCEAHSLHAEQVAIFDRLDGFNQPYKCPYGQPGDRLWVRETFCPIYPQDPNYNGGNPIEYDYAATYKHGDRLGDSIGIKKKWTPSIHMPRAASRITLEITGIRVERLQDISEADAVAEGLRAWVGAPPSTKRYGIEMADVWESDPRKAYKRLWESINGAGSWEANPWVWCITFRRIKP